MPWEGVSSCEERAYERGEGERLVVGGVEMGEGEGEVRRGSECVFECGPECDEKDELLECCCWTSLPKGGVCARAAAQGSDVRRFEERDTRGELVGI